MLRSVPDFIAYLSKTLLTHETEDLLGKENLFYGKFVQQKLSFTLQEVKFILAETDKKFRQTHVTNILPGVENFPSDDFGWQKFGENCTFSDLNDI